MAGDGWTTIESDPGVFTELISAVGVKGVEVAELYDLGKETFEQLGKVYGLIFLFKWQRDEPDPKRVPIEQGVPGVFFARQVINNACATQAIISVLLNRADVDLGKELGNFKEFTMNLPSDMRGMAIGNSDLIRRSHNSFARPEPFVSDEKAPSGGDDDVFHFVGYVPVNGALFELDGLQPGPIRLCECTMENWLEKAGPAIQARIAKYSEKEIRFNLLALVKDRRETLGERAAAARTRIERIQAQLGGKASSMDTDEDNADALPADAAGLRAALQTSEGELKQINDSLADEHQKRKKWAVENTRRKHNYVPFVFQLLRLLAKKGELKRLTEEGAAAVKERMEKQKKAKEEAAEKAKAKAAEQAAKKE